jgi:uncharacterized protein (TIGR00266 family)
MIEFACEQCGAAFTVASEYAGRTATCKRCGGAVKIPTIASTGSANARAAGSPAPATPAAVVRGSSPDFTFEISQRPDFSLITIGLDAGKQIFAEPAAMACMSPSIELKAGFKGGLRKTLGRAFGGESLIVNTFTAKAGPGEVVFAPGAAGDAAHYRLSGGSLLMQRGAFVCHGPGVEISGKWQGAKSFFGGEGLVLLKASGQGDLFFNSYGAILPVDVKDEYIVDTGYIVAFEDTLDYSVTVLPGLRSSSKLKTFFFGGEGLVCRFRGEGKLWVQTRLVQSFLSWVHPFRPTRN